MIYIESCSPPYCFCNSLACTSCETTLVYSCILAPDILPHRCEIKCHTSPSETIPGHEAWFSILACTGRRAHYPRCLSEASTHSNAGVASEITFYHETRKNATLHLSVRGLSNMRKKSIPRNCPLYQDGVVQYTGEHLRMHLRTRICTFLTTF